MSRKPEIKWPFFLKAIFLCVGIFSQQTALAKEGVEKAGDVLQILIPAVGLGATIFYEKGNEGTIQFFKSLATSQLITKGLKTAIDKRRPDGECCDSFPSGHTSTAFMGAGFIHKRYGWKYAIPAYTGAIYVGFSRVHADKHFVEDVVAGAAVGILSSYYFAKPYNGFYVTPVASNGVYGISISKKW